MNTRSMYWIWLKNCNGRCRMVVSRCPLFRSSRSRVNLCHPIYLFIARTSGVCLGSRYFLNLSYQTCFELMRLGRTAGWIMGLFSAHHTLDPVPTEQNVMSFSHTNLCQSTGIGILWWYGRVYGSGDAHPCETPDRSIILHSTHVLLLDGFIHCFALCSLLYASPLCLHQVCGMNRQK